MHSDFLSSLESGKLRAAEKINGEWRVNHIIKEKILDVFKSSKLVTSDGFIDKEPLIHTRQFSIDASIRVVPGGTSIRRGVYISNGVVIMPPSYVNIGAYVDEGTMIDSNVLVGSCAQIGKRVHLSAGVQIGGVLEPINNRPVIIEDDCFIGAGAIITDGILIKENAVIAQGVNLSKSIPIYDVIKQNIIYNEVPSGAVVIPGTRPLLQNKWALDQNLSIACAIIIKYRDSKTSATIELESALR